MTTIKCIALFIVVSTVGCAGSNSQMLNQAEAKQAQLSHQIDQLKDSATNCEKASATINELTNALQDKADQAWEASKAGVKQEEPVVSKPVKEQIEKVLPNLPPEVQAWVRAHID